MSASPYRSNPGGPAGRDPYPGGAADPGAYPGGPYGTGESGPGAYPSPTGARAAAIAQPSTVRTAFLCWLGQVVLSLCAAVYGLVTMGSAVDEALSRAIADNPGVDRAALEAGAKVGYVAGIAIGIVLTLLIALFAFKMRDGKGWARIVLTVLGVLQLILVPFGLMQQPGPVKVLQVIMALLVLAALVFMWLKPSNDYFGAHKAARHQP